MVTHKSSIIVDDYFYGKLSIPNKVSYIKHVAKSCRNYEELESVEKWGYKILYDAYNLFIRIISNQHYYVSTITNAIIKFSENFDAWQDDMAKAFKQLAEELPEEAVMEQN